MRPRPLPLSRTALLARIAGSLAGLHPGHPLRVAIDGAPVTGTTEVARELDGLLRLRGRPVLRVSAADFLRPAALRLERGRRDPDALYEDSLDVAGLRREVLDPLGTGGSGRYLPSLWDAATDRASRAAYADAPAGAVALVEGAFLLRPVLAGCWDVAVHLHVSAAALRRRTPTELAWQLPAYDRYSRDNRPRDSADVVVLLDDPGHPAVLDRISRRSTR